MALGGDVFSSQPSTCPAQLCEAGVPEGLRVEVSTLQCPDRQLQMARFPSHRVPVMAEKWVR